MTKKETKNTAQHVNVGKRLADELYMNCLGGNEETTAMTDDEKEAFIAQERMSGIPGTPEAKTQDTDRLRQETREKLSAALGIDLNGPVARPARRIKRPVWKNNGNGWKKATGTWFQLPVVRQTAAAAIIASVLFTGGKWGYKRYSQYQCRTASAGKLLECSGDSSVMLSDSTSVRLQGGSRLTAAMDFGKQERRVELDGQAYIHAAPDAHRPYIVDMPHGLSLKVKGTIFNVNAYADNPLSEITVVSGCVEIRNELKNINYGLFHKGDHLVYNAQTGEVLRGKVDLSEKMAWMTRHIEFDRASVAEFRQKMFDVFGKTIIVEGDAFGREPVEIHASFNNVKDLTYTDVLDDLQELYHFVYIPTGNTITLTPGQ